MPKVKCDCGKEEFTFGCSELDWDLVSTDERQMGAENTYSATWEENCPQCGAQISVTFDCYEYPVGSYNYHEVETIGCSVDEYCCPDFSRE